MESYLLPNDDQLPLIHLASQIEVVHSLVQRLWIAFSEICLLKFLLDTVYVDDKLALPLRYLSILASFSTIFLIFSFHNLFVDVVSACSIAC